MRNSTFKAAIVTALFAGFGVVGLFKDVAPWTASFIVLYALLLVHTFLSVRCFSAIIDPTDKTQLAVDLLLILSYLALGLSIKAWEFLVWWVVLFLFATLKYALLVGRLHHPNLLRRKLVADVSGAGLGVFTLNSWSLFIGFIPGLFFMTEWLVVGLFVIGSLYYFFVRPLYVPDRPV